MKPQQLQPSEKTTKTNEHGRRRTVIIIVLAGFILTLFGIAFAPSLRVNQNPIHYTTTQAKRGDLTVIVTATGKLEPVNRVDVGSEVSGTIDVVEVDYNDKVEAGQVLARLDTSQLDARLRQSSASLILAKATVVDAEATLKEMGNRLKRIQDLKQKDSASQENLDSAIASYARAEAAIAVAKAKVDQSQAQLDSDQRALDKAIIRSPIDGLVLQRRVEKGQTVAATLQTPVLFTLADNLRTMVLHIDVDEADIGQIAVGQIANFTVDAFPDRTFPAKITQIRFSPKAIDGVVSYETLLFVENPTMELLPGMTATAEIVVADYKDVLLVPNSVLRFTPRNLLPDNTKPRRPGLMGWLSPKPLVSSTLPPDTITTGSKIWTLRNGIPTPVPVKVIATDGTLSYIKDDDIDIGTELIVDMSLLDD